MPNFILHLIFISALLLLTPQKASAETSFSPANICQTCLKGKSIDFNRMIDRLEHAYIQYRWVEAKIRRLYYEDLWAARYDEVNPLDKIKREKGKKRVLELEENLKSLEKNSQSLSNLIWKKNIALQNYREQLSCHPENAVRTCFDQNFQSIYDHLAAMKIEFDHIFESEREYRKAVSLTAGSRHGLYPQDALEKPVLHKEYYWRFEQERSPKRYAEDAKMMDAFNLLRELTLKRFTDASCCVILEKQAHPKTP